VVFARARVKHQGRVAEDGGATAKPDEVTSSLRLALTPAEAAQALGCSRDFFDKHIGPELRWVRRGRLKFVVIAEMEDWLRRSAALTLGDD
jgi:hypothetical protein